MVFNFDSVSRWVAVGVVVLANGSYGSAQNGAQKVLVGDAKVTMLQSYNGAEKLSTSTG